MRGIRHIPAGALHVSKPTHWLESRFHFSFADYFNPSNQNFGALRVLNDDLVKSGNGFGWHPHRDAEIFSYVLDGELTHQDSMGNKESLARGGVQYLSAGTGVTHQEMNDGTERCRFIQVWITPDERGHAPQYGSTVVDEAARHNVLRHVLSGTGEAPAWTASSERPGVALHQDCNVFLSQCDAGHALEVSLGADRQAYLLCMEGSLHANDAQLAARDAAEVVAGGAALPVKLTAGGDGAHFMLIEMQQA